MLAEVKIGPRRSRQGAVDAMRGGLDAEGVVSQAHARFYEASLGGYTFSGGTASAGVAPGTTVSTTAGFALFNPAGSGRRLVVLRVSWGYVSGTIGTGTTYYNANTNPAAAAVTGTAITAVPTLIGSPNQASGRAFTTATLPVAPTLLRPFLTLSPMLATSVLTPVLVVDDVDGEFVIDEGGCLSLHSVAAAGTSPLVVYGMTWEEVAK